MVRLIKSMELSPACETAGKKNFLPGIQVCTPKVQC
jgi:hypothetical protein